MPSDWRTQFSQEALAKVDAFIVEHPGYLRAGVEQPGQGATNRVFFARRDEELVVFKVFCEAERKERECFALCHWAQTGLVPALIWDADPQMIVMSHIPGVYLDMTRRAHGEVVWREACRGVGTGGSPGRKWTCRPERRTSVPDKTVLKTRARTQQPGTRSSLQRSTAT